MGAVKKIKEEKGGEMRFTLLLAADLFLAAAGFMGGILASLVGTAGVPVRETHPIFHLKGGEYVAAIVAAAALATLLRLAARRVS